MLFISPSFALSKIFLRSVAACVGLISISCFAQSPFFVVDATPYDNQMARVWPVLASTSVQLPGPTPSWFAVNQWMSELRAIPYQYSTYWQTPSEVNLAQVADCKGKAVALYAEMRRNGVKNVRIVIGKRHIYSSVTHAWLEWETREGSYVLDPTFNEVPLKTAELDPMTYVPLYAYDGEHKYRAADASSIASTAKVAAGYSNHFYVLPGARSTLRQPGSVQIRAGQSLPATTEYAMFNTGRPQAYTRRLSSHVESIRQAGVPAAAPNAEYMIREQPTSVSIRGRATHNVRYITSNTARLRQVRRSVSSQNLEYVMRAQARRLAPQL